MTEISTADRLDPNGYIEEIRRVLKGFGLGEKTYVPLYRFIPLIEPLSPFIRLIKDIGFPIVIVPFHEIVKHGLVDDIVYYGINRVLGYEGYVLLSSIMPDEMLNDETFNLFLEVAIRGGFYGVIGWDMPVYADVSLDESWSNLVISIDKTLEFARSGINTIPLAKGVNREQIETGLDTYVKAGFKTIALHISDYIYAYRSDPLARRLFYIFLRELYKRFENILLVGISSPYNIRKVMRRYPRKMFYAGRGWYISGLKGLAYTSYRTIDLEKKSIVCSCQSCQNKPLTFSEDTYNIIRHNLYMVNNIFHGISPDIEVLDIVLQGRTLVLSDIHIGLPHSRVRDAERLIVKLRPDNIVFLGDIIDFDNRQYPNENTAIFEAINIVNPRVFAGVRGEAEDTRRLYSVLDNAVGIGFESNYQAPYLLGFITLYKYYRVIKPQLTAYLPDNTRAVFIHGHQIKGPHTVKWLRKELGVEWIFHGHTHRFHIDNREKIVNTGCWLEEEWERKFNNRVVDSGKAVLIEKDGALTEIDYTDYL